MLTMYRRHIGWKIATVTLTIIALALAALAAIAVLGIAQPAWAQEVAIGTATATVLAAVTVTAAAVLEFGDVFQGVPKSVANSSASAAVFTVAGQADAGISLYFQLPEYLVLSNNADRVTILFSATDCSVDTTGANSPTTMNGTKGWQNTDPRSLPNTVAIGSAGTSVYLGGKIVPSLYQQAGSYSGDIILTVSYNGT